MNERAMQTTIIKPRSCTMTSDFHFVFIKHLRGAFNHSGKAFKRIMFQCHFARWQLQFVVFLCRHIIYGIYCIGKCFVVFYFDFISRNSVIYYVQGGADFKTYCRCAAHNGLINHWRTGIVDRRTEENITCIVCLYEILPWKRTYIQCVNAELAFVFVFCLSRQHYQAFLLLLGI